MDVLLTEPPVSRSGDAAEGSDEEEVEEEVEEGERIHVSLLGRKKKTISPVLKCHFFRGGLVRLAARSEWLLRG